MPIRYQEIRRFQLLDEFLGESSDALAAVAIELAADGDKFVELVIDLGLPTETTIIVLGSYETSAVSPLIEAALRPRKIRQGIITA